MRCLKGDTAFEPFSPARTEEDEPAHMSERYAPAADEPIRLARHGGVSGIVAPGPGAAQGDVEARNGITWHM